MLYTREEIEKTAKDNGYVYFNSDSDYDVNVIAIRNNSPGTKVTNVFDDLITISYKVNGVWQFHMWACTTDPGTKAVKEYHNPNGVARLVPGQYRSSHEIRKHQGKYFALCQKGSLKVYRDKNKDMNFDEITIQEGSNFGINIHHAGANSSIVENWSEGCTVFKRIKDFDEFMVICNKAKQIHGNSFSYTLLNSNDIKKKLIMKKITKMGPNGLALTKISEGFRSKPYLCPAKVATIGYGSTYYLNGKKVTLKDKAITEDEALILLIDLLKSYEKAVDSFVRDDINQNQFDALVDFAYNCGVGNLKASTLLKKVNANPNDPTIADEFRRWVYGGDGSRNGVDDDGDGLIDEPGEKQRLRGLVKRREAQATLYFKK